LMSDVGQLRVVGDLPLVIVAWGSMTIGGSIEASGRNGNGGPGFNPKDVCTAGEGNDAGSFVLGGGGGGGGFQGAGGKGGGGAAGMAANTAPPQTLRGGCNG